jgi:hypothetical protein
MAKAKRRRSPRYFRPQQSSTIHLLGNRKAKVFRDKQLQRIMDLIDKEADAKGRLPHGCIRRYYEEEYNG